jgi:hypothetical protein
MSFIVVKQMPSPRDKQVSVTAWSFGYTLAHSTFLDDYGSAEERLLREHEQYVKLHGPLPVDVTPVAAPVSAPVAAPAPNTDTARLKQSECEEPLYRTLAYLGGKASKKYVFKHIEALLPLHPFDYTLNSQNIPRWQERVSWCVSKLRKIDKTILPATQEGIWELAPATFEKWSTLLKIEEAAANG